MNRSGLTSHFSNTCFKKIWKLLSKCFRIRAITVVSDSNEDDGHSASEVSGLSISNAVSIILHVVPSVSDRSICLLKRKVKIGFLPYIE